MAEEDHEAIDPVTTISVTTTKCPVRVTKTVEGGGTTISTVHMRSSQEFFPNNGETYTFEELPPVAQEAQPVEA